jgi:hypothetical protein
VIDASSNTGIDGNISIDSEEVIDNSMLPLETPPLDISQLLTERCAAQLEEERSSLTAVQQLPNAQPAPGDYLPSPLLGPVTTDPDSARTDGSATPNYLAIPARSVCRYALLLSRND